MGTDKKMISVEIPLSLYTQLKELSTADDRSLSAYVRKTLDEHVRKSSSNV